MTNSAVDRSSTREISQDAGDRDVEVLVDVAHPAFDDDHRPVVEEAHALTRLLAFLDDADAQLLAGQHRRLHGVGERVDVHHPDALQLGDAVQVEIVREDHPAPGTRERDELGIDLGLGRDGVLDDLDRRARFLLHPVEDLEAPAAAVASEGVRAVGDVLQLIEHEARHDQRAIDEARFDDLGDPPVDDRRGVDDDARLTGSVLRPKILRPPEEADRVGGHDQVTALCDGQPEHPESEEQRDAER